jgi:hypothetical protein
MNCFPPTLLGCLRYAHVCTGSASRVDDVSADWVYCWDTNLHRSGKEAGLLPPEVTVATVFQM